jgi:molybdopterin synthase catalytic subunit
VILRVLYFGIVKELMGCAEATLTLPEGARAQDVIDPERLGERAASIVIARNQKFVRREEPLRDGDEVALLPPVSGGNAYTHWWEDASGHCAGITRETIQERELIDRLRRDEDGAVGTFLGVVRNHSGGRRTLHLDYEGYEPMALQVMADLAREVAERHAVGRVGMVHRLGRLEIGEASVCVVVTSPHRQAAFEACLEGINRLKKTVPIWKKEYFEDGEVWVEGEWDESLRS